MKKVVYISFIIFFLFSSCKTTSQIRKEKEIESQKINKILNDKLVGKHKSEIMLNLGPPQDGMFKQNA